MKRILNLSCLVIFLYSSQICLAQPTLVLLKPGKNHHFYYQIGDKVSYMDKTSGRKLSGKILILTDSTLELDRAPRIRLSNISIVYRTRYFFEEAAGAGIIILGVYVPISILNRAFHHQHPLVDDDIYYLNGPMLAISGISMLLITRRFRLGEHWRIEVLDFGHPVYN
jgi:hypothetical protein